MSFFWGGGGGGSTCRSCFTKKNKMAISQFRRKNIKAFNIIIMIKHFPTLNQSFHGKKGLSQIMKKLFTMIGFIHC